jgi:methionyl-tRNA synthetase
MLNIDSFTWESLGSTNLLAEGHALQAAELLFEKIEDAAIDAQIQRLLDTKKANEQAAWQPQAAKEDIQFEDFTKLDIRIGTILEAKPVPKTSKLMQLLVDTGLDKRTIVSGVSESFKPEDMIGKQVPVLINLKPRSFRGIESHGMILYPSDAEGKYLLMSPEREVRPGTVLA